MMLTSKSIITSLSALAAFVAILTGSCAPDRGDTSDYTVIDNTRWAYGDTLWFTLKVDSTVTDGVIEVALRHTNEYPYSNIWLEVNTVDKAGVTHADTVGIDLCDAYGRWYGYGFGDSYQVIGRIKEQRSLDTLAQIGVRHIMRTDTLRGLDQAGVRYVSATK